MAQSRKKNPSPKRKTKTKAKRARGRSWPMRIAYWGTVTAAWGLVGLIGLTIWFAYDLPSLDRFAEVDRRPSVTLLATDGSRLATYGDVYGKAVTLEEVPVHLPQAVLAVEDKRFYQHPGIDLRGLLRAIYANIKAGRIVQGGSTISQQLAKNLFLTPERTYKRKVQELLLAFWLENRLSKDQILNLYLNRVYLGAGTYGVDAAAQRYFGKRAMEVNLYEAALLAGLLKAPSRYNPANDPARADRRTQLVLDEMVESGFVSQQEADQAFKAKTRGKLSQSKTPRYYADWILAQVHEFVGKGERDLVVQTTLDPSLQVIAEQEVSALLANEGQRRAAEQAAFVALSPSGAVRAMVGGGDYAVSQFNRATQALRQPGSAFKAFVYMAALEAGHQPDDRMVDRKIRVGDWAPRNYGDRYYGEVTLREAFARSLNSVAVQLTQETGPESVAGAARRLGITSSLNPTPSLALGAAEVSLLDLTGAYAAFANRGAGVWPYGIERIEDAKGAILYQRSGGGPGQLVDAVVVDRMNDIMTANVVWGTGKAAQVQGWQVAGKTGTSQEFRDAWFIGLTSHLVAGVWLGNDDGRPMNGVTGGSLPAQLWGRIMNRGLAGVAPRPLPEGGVLVAENQAAEDDGLITRILRKLGGGGDSAPAAATQRSSGFGDEREGGR